MAAAENTKTNLRAQDPDTDSDAREQDQTTAQHGGLHALVDLGNEEKTVNDPNCIYCALV